MVSVDYGPVGAQAILDGDRTVEPIYYIQIKKIAEADHRSCYIKNFESEKENEINIYIFV